ncbi:interleukin-like EMT inducer domain-containing protein (plasmid) [Aneurinibacillus sp. Ricciae_BoGa-3]|uniref:OmpL47-type beta-barrel domain-containing protein n=1 Tax=Aneurinibacillus sp. Ricciae_BoGa-3 TaxID=3022697 RepID=UPI00233FE747|nr:interleukin-like EMT inducer domain-containing protein [Aneurinibacillus sp. Ricciae_BoGa-3]WCK57677.1 interleukin-like EMT inducer domain-containing protein [Aneurinibacillus sp. Ricciae_BoGa-3]
MKSNRGIYSTYQIPEEERGEINVSKKTYYLISTVMCDVSCHSFRCVFYISTYQKLCRATDDMHHFTITSAGDNLPAWNWHPQATVSKDNSLVYSGGRGWSLVALDPKTMNVIKQQDYDTYGNLNLGDNLANDINNLPRGTVIFLAINDAIGTLTTNLRNTMKAIGLTNANTINYDGNWSYQLPGQRMSLVFGVYKGGSQILYDYDNTGSTILTKSVDIREQRPALTITPNPSGNFVHMDWNPPENGQPYNYMVYKKQEGVSSFQTVPAKATSHVLNIYPSVSDTISFTNWKGQSYTLPKSASLKMWMEQPNNEDPKGYGKGLINVDSVSKDDFNANPNAYLKNADGSWKYDTVFFGSWDCNGSCDISGDISTQARDTLIPWIQSGRGILFGHDTLIQSNGWGGHPNFTSLRFYFNIENGGFEVADIPWIGSSQVQIQKKGLLTNYPWSIGDIGTVLDTPYSHSTGDIAVGDIWMQYYHPSAPLTTGAVISDPNTGLGTNNFYLTTWNNTAMIQTGHSSGMATPDEQKVLANTLFYLSQTTNQTSWDEHSGQDLTPPDAPPITNVVPDVNANKTEIGYTSVSDKGTTYQYYVEAIGANDNVRTQSDIKTLTITSGLKGYSIVVDTNPNTIPDATIETTSTHYTVNQLIAHDFYVHVASVDNAGNISNVSHYHYVDNTPPTLSVASSNTNWTTGNVVLTATASDNESGLNSIQTPDGNWIQSSSATYTVSSNGTFTFVAKDNMGNTTTKTIVVSNIDKTVPTEPVINNNTSWTNVSSVPVSVTSGQDGQSGVSKTEYKLEGATNQGYVTYAQSFAITNEGVTKITARTFDNVGNVSNETVSYVRIDRSAPMNTSILIQLK